jgi:hypothetical protein
VSELNIAVTATPSQWKPTCCHCCLTKLVDQHLKWGHCTALQINEMAPGELGWQTNTTNDNEWLLCSSISATRRDKLHNHPVTATARHGMAAGLQLPAGTAALLLRMCTAPSIQKTNTCAKLTLLANRCTEHMTCALDKGPVTQQLPKVQPPQGKPCSKRSTAALTLPPLACRALMFAS